MSSLDNRKLTVGNAGQAFDLVKQPTDVFKYFVDFTEWLPAGVTVTSVAAAVIAPTDVTNAPTLTAGTVVTNGFPITFTGGLVAWNGGKGSGTASMLVTLSDTEKKEVNFNLRLVDLP